MNDVLPAPFIQYRRQALPRVVCSLATGSALCCKLLTLLNVIARRQSAGFAPHTDHPVVMLIGDCCYGGRTRGWRERRQVKMALKTDFNVAVVGGDNSSAGK